MICPTCKGGKTLLKKVQGKGCYEVVLAVCDQCNGTGEIKATNFQRITASPEALAKWVCEITDFCDRGCSRCPIQKQCLYDCDGAGNSDKEELLIEWLNRESDAE